MVKELLPAFVAVVAEVDMGQWIMPAFDGIFYESHSGDFWCPAALFDVARRTGTNDIFPRGFTAQAPGNDMVQGQFTGREPFAAILAAVFISCEDIAPIKFHFVSRQAVVK